MRGTEVRAQFRSGFYAFLIGGLAANSVLADHQADEELLIVAYPPKGIVQADVDAVTRPDSAALLKTLAGANINQNGPLTGIAQYRGMYGDRVKVTVDGASISSGGPNAMDTPLSYAPGVMLESLRVVRGIAPVSAGQESIGGVIHASTNQGGFGDSRQSEFTGRLHLGGQTAGSAWSTHSLFNLGNEDRFVSLGYLQETGDDADFPDGTIEPSEYERKRYDLNAGWIVGNHEFRVGYAQNETDDAGTPSLPMDIDYIDADLVRGSWRYATDELVVEARVYRSDIEHGMANYLLRPAPLNNRYNYATGDSSGFSVRADFINLRSTWSIGADGHFATHNSDISDPGNAMFFVENFNEAERNILGLFVENSRVLSNHWRLDTGIRYNRVSMDSDEVNGTPAMMNPVAGQLRDNFNAADRSIDDDNIDWVAKVFYEPSEEWHWYVGVARKSRSASYQERYLWLPMQATAGLADGNTYIGNIELDPEVSHEIELGLDWQAGDLSVAPRIFYRDVSDYIQGTPVTDMSIQMFSGMMMGDPTPLQFNNVDAEFYGLDVEWTWQIDDRWSLGGVVNYVRTEMEYGNVEDDVYRVAPPNAIFSLNYNSQDWYAVIEQVLYYKQSHVSSTNEETESSGYGVTNVRAVIDTGSAWRVNLGIRNLFDKTYRDHLSGVNRVMGSDIAVGDRVPGAERSLYASLEYKW
jgi:iron complex outermembrane receptor protein